MFGFEKKNWRNSDYFFAENRFLFGKIDVRLPKRSPEEIVDDSPSFIEEKVKEFSLEQLNNTDNFHENFKKISHLFFPNERDALIFSNKLEGLGNKFLFNNYLRLNSTIPSEYGVQMYEEFLKILMQMYDQKTFIWLLYSLFF
jgi:hypothetical protein